LASLDGSLERSRADAKAGRVKPAEEVFDRLEAKYTRMTQEGENPERGDL
jgi:antitoxin ParD1/3/4